MERENRVATLAFAYFALQVGIPAAIWSARSPAVPSDFSWDMFSTRVTCPTLVIGAVPASGPPRRIPTDALFSKSAHLRRVLYPERIHALAEHLCPKLAAEDSGHVELRMWIECVYAPDGEPVRITDRSRDYCAPR